MIGDAREPDTAESVEVEMPLSDPNDLQAFSPWKLDFRQVGTGHLETRLAFRSKSAVSVLRLNMSEVMHQRGQSPNGVVTFALSRAGALRQWQGEVATPQTMFGFGAGAAFDCVSEAGFEADVLSFDLGRFQALADQCGFALSDDALTARLWDTSNSPNDLAGVASHISSLLSVPARDWPEDSEEDLGLALLRLMTDGAEHLDRSPFRARDRAMRRALDVTDTTLDDPLPIPEICKLSGASWRTLDRAFKENFDIGPKSYYLRLRLLRARQMLGASGPRGSVGEVANMNGFWHMGQFARDYRKLFGERPSETVALRE